MGDSGDSESGTSGTDTSESDISDTDDSESDESDSGDVDGDDAGSTSYPADGDGPSPSAGYDVLAERADDGLDRAASPWGNSYFQQYYSWPATRSLLPDSDSQNAPGGQNAPVDQRASDGQNAPDSQHAPRNQDALVGERVLADQRVLIAGCGRGDHVEWFLDRGAAVVGLDASEAAVETARRRFGDEAEFHRADLTDPLDLPDGAFDLVFSHLVLGHVADWDPVFEEFRRVLTNNGRVVLAVVHPAYLRDEYEVTNYYDAEELVVSWPGTEIPTYYRPPSAMLAPLVSAGFRLEAFEEPRPQDEYAEYAPDRYEKAIERPAVLCLRARVAREEPDEK